MPLFAFLAAVLLTPEPTVWANDDHASDSLRRDGQGRPLVDVVAVDKRAYPFLLDTAASRTVVYRTFVSLLGLEADPRRSRRVITATGPREMQVYRVSGLHALGTGFDLRETVALPDPDIRGVYGILGVDIMRDRRLLIEASGIGFLENEGTPDAQASAWLTVKGRPVGYGSLAVTVHVAGLDIPAIVDTGAGASVLNRKAAEALGQKAGVHKGQGRATVSASARALGAEILTVDTLSIGEWQKVNQRLVVADLPVFSAFGAKHAPAMILGADILLSERRLVIDFKDWQLLVEPAKE